MNSIGARRERDPGPKAKAMCGAWLAGEPVPERQDSVNPWNYHLS